MLWKSAMSKQNYFPDNWVVLKMSPGSETLYKVLGGWSGGYLDGDSWRMNSGITKVTEEGDDYLKFWGYSGSCYVCHKNSYGLRMNNSGIYNQLKEKFGVDVELMPEDTDWEELFRP